MIVAGFYIKHFVDNTKYQYCLLMAILQIKGFNEKADFTKII